MQNKTERIVLVEDTVRSCLLEFQFFIATSDTYNLTTKNSYYPLMFMLQHKFKLCLLGNLPETARPCK